MSMWRDNTRGLLQWEWRDVIEIVNLSVVPWKNPIAVSLVAIYVGVLHYKPCQGAYSIPKHPSHLTST